MERHHAEHQQNVSAIIDVLDSKGGVPAVVAPPEAQAIEPAAPQALAETEGPAPPGPEVSSGASAVAEDAPGPAAARSRQPETISERLARSVEIQRRADAASKRSHSDATARRAQIDAERRAAEQLRKDAEQRATAIADQERHLLDVQSRYTREVERATTDPLSFLREHGIGGAEIAEFVKQGADPTARQMSLMEHKVSKALDNIRAEYRNELNAVRQQMHQANVAEVQRGFFDYVESSAKQAPDQYDAMRTIYSDEELWAKADELANKSDRLQLAWDRDRLLEEIESEAKRDPRWQRVQARLAPSAPKQAPNASQNAKPQPRAEQPSSQPAPQEARQPAATRPRREMPSRDESGQFRTASPREIHKQHLENIMSRVGRFGS